MEVRELQGDLRNKWEIVGCRSLGDYSRQDSEPTSSFLQRAKAHEQEIAQLQQDIEWAETTGQREDLNMKCDVSLNVVWFHGVADGQPS